MKKIITICLLFLILLGSYAFSAQDPFSSGEKTEQRREERINYPRFLEPVLSVISSWQKALRGHLSRLGREIRENPSGRSFWLFLLFSFVYGAIHALGPGHGKSIVYAYFLSRPGNYFQGLFMGNFITFTHVSSAVAVVLVTYCVLKTAGLTSFESARVTMEKISYALLILLGIFLFGYKIYELRTDKSSTWLEPTTHRAGFRDLIFVALATGLVPCPGAALVLVFAITLKILVPGLLAMMFIAVGMGLTTSFFALFSIASRNAIFHLTARSHKIFTLAHASFSLAGALAITLIGSLLFFSEF